MMKNKLAAGYLVLFGLAGSMPAAYAQFEERTDGIPTPIASLGGVMGVISEIARWMFNILMGLGIIFVIYAAFLYLIAGGSDEKISNAKRVLIYAIVAMVIGVLAGGVRSVVENFGTSVGGVETQDGDT